MDYVNDVKLKSLQSIECRLLKEIDNLCKENQISYYLAFGTLLGAIRHKGFIPWDDDIDILMEREEYEKFLELDSTKLPNNIKIRHYKASEKSETNISIQAKVEIEGKYIIRQVGSKQEKQNIWIDIFVIDGMPNNSFYRCLHYYNIIFHQSLYRIARSQKNGTLKDKKRGKIEKLVIKLCGIVPIGKLLNTVKLMEQTERIFRRCSVEKCDYVIAYAPEYGKKCIVPKSIFQGKRFQEFEGMMLPIPTKSEDLLTAWYGDYMELPPIEKRIYKHSIEICEDNIDE